MNGFNTKNNNLSAIIAHRETQHNSPKHVQIVPKGRFVTGPFKSEKRIDIMRVTNDNLIYDSDNKIQSHILSSLT